MFKQFAVTGIGTDVGKTVVSAILAESLCASYWKPVQAGDLHNSDSIKLEQLTHNVTVLKERFQLIQLQAKNSMIVLSQSQRQERGIS